MVLFSSLPSDELSTLRSALPNTTSDSCLLARYPWLSSVLISHNATDDLKTLLLLHSREDPASASELDDISTHLRELILDDFKVYSMSTSRPVDSLRTAQFLSKADVLMGSEPDCLRKESRQLIERMQATWDAATTMNTALLSCDALDSESSLSTGERTDNECCHLLDAIDAFVQDPENYHEDFPRITTLRRMSQIERGDCPRLDGDAFTSALPLENFHDEVIEYLKELTEDLSYYETRMPEGQACA